MDAQELAHTHTEVHVAPHGFVRNRIRGSNIDGNHRRASKSKLLGALSLSLSHHCCCGGSYPYQIPPCSHSKSSDPVCCVYCVVWTQGSGTSYAMLGMMAVFIIVLVWKGKEAYEFLSLSNFLSSSLLVTPVQVRDQGYPLYIKGSVDLMNWVHCPCTLILPFSWAFKWALGSAS